MSDEAAETAPRPRWRGWLQVGVGLVLLAAALYFARAPSVGSSNLLIAGEQAKPEVRVVHPKAGSHAFTANLTGEVTLEAEIPIISESAGRVIEVAAGMESGGSFAANETLIQIDPTDAELDLRSAQLGVERAAARLRKQELKGEFEAAAWERANPGREAPAIIRREPQIDDARAVFEGTQVALDAAKRNLDLTSVSLPFAGRVLASTVAVGQLVGPTNPLGIVYRTRSLQVEVPVSPQMLSGLQPVAGRSASVNTGRRTFEAEVDRATRALDTITRQATMFLKFKGAAEEELPGPGTFVQVRLTGEEYADAFLLPESTRQASDRVWIVKDGKLDSVTPKTLSLAEAGWIVASFGAEDGVVSGPVPNAVVGMEVDVADD